MNLDLNNFKRLNKGDRVEPLKADYLIEVESVEDGGFLRDSAGFLWHRSNLKDRVFLGVSQEVFEYLNYDFMNIPTLVLQYYQADGASNELWPQELEELYINNQKGLFDAILHKSYFVKKED